MRFTRIVRLRTSVRLANYVGDGVKRNRTLKEMYEVLGVQDGASPTELKKAYINKVKENHPDKVDESKEDRIEIDELKQIYDKILEITTIEKEEMIEKGTGTKKIKSYKGTTWTLDDYRQGKHKKADHQDLLQGNFIRFVIMCPLMLLFIDKSWDFCTDLKGRNERATFEYEEKLYLKALEEYKIEQAALEKAQLLNPELFKNAETA